MRYDKTNEYEKVNRLIMRISDKIYTCQSIQAKGEGIN